MLLSREKNVFIQFNWEWTNFHKQGQIDRTMTLSTCQTILIVLNMSKRTGWWSCWRFALLYLIVHLIHFNTELYNIQNKALFRVKISIISFIPIVHSWPNKVVSFPHNFFIYFCEKVELIYLQWLSLYKVSFPLPFILNIGLCA